MKLRITPIIALCIASIGFALTIHGQVAESAQPQRSTARAESSITGRVVNESGQPMRNVLINVYGPSRGAARRLVTTDESGRFIATDLPRGSYAVAVQAKGYLLVREPGEFVRYRPGDSVNLVVKKGGVITGTVINANGDPVIGMPVTAFVVRDAQGRRSGGYTPARYTDDRGVYRLFNLAAGTYIVAAGAKTSISSTDNAYADDVPTYYPSSTRDTAAEVAIQYGMEATGIDIRYRGEKGHVVSGRIADSALGSAQEASTSVRLLRTATNTLEAQAAVVPHVDQRSFALYGVADGDYYIFARRGSYEADDGAASKRIPVTVRGRDVTGIAISLAPLGSLAGRVTLDPGTRNLRCESNRAPAIEETLLSFSTDDSTDIDPSWQLATALLPPDDKGDFIFRGLPAARYRLDIPRFLEPACYVRALTVSGPAGGVVDAGRDGLNLRPGQRISGIRVVIGEGAASIQGRVVAERKGASLPERLRIHLVPAERESAGEMLRYFESEVQNDGHFRLFNLAPGRYWILALPVSDNGLLQRVGKPLAWNAATRTALRRDAEALNTIIELRPCQRVADFEVRYVAVPDSPNTK